MLPAGAERSAVGSPGGAGLVKALAGRSIVLVGMPGAGKSSVGRRLAAAIDLPFRDADAEIEAAAGMAITDIFERHGEPAFRDGERRVIARLLSEGQQVLATGGGAFMDPRTRQAVREHGVSVWLQADIATLIARIKRKSSRPLLKTADPRATLEALYAQRAPAFAESDLWIVSGDGPHDSVVASIIERLTGRLAVASPGDLL